MSEKAVLFGKFQTLVGVLHSPPPDRRSGGVEGSEGEARPLTSSNAPLDTSGGERPLDKLGERPGIILANAGLIHRIGPNRVYVKLARALAAQGYPVLRFDLSGVGDSAPRPDQMPVERFVIDDVCQAMEYMAQTCGSRQFLLMGHCAGAYHSFRTAAEDPRVAGAVLINPDGGEAEWVEFDKKRKLASYYQHYYAKKNLLDPQLWKRVLTLRVNFRSIFKNLFRDILWNRVSTLAFRLQRRIRPKPATPTAADEALFTMEAILRRAPQLKTRLLLIYSENATSLERIQTSMPGELRALQSSGQLHLEVIPGADHIFTPLATQKRLVETICAWLTEIPFPP